MSKINVLVVDDSALVRQTFREILEGDSSIASVDAAQDPLFAMEKMKKHWPDVIILDIEMPRMDGITFLKKIMSEKPTPVIICSTLSQEGAKVTLEALESGAVHIITKPQVGAKSFLQEQKDYLVQTVRGVASASMKKQRQVKETKVEPKLTADSVLSSSVKHVAETTDKIVAIGTSAGGTQALEAILPVLPVEVPGILVVQHMPEQFTKAFADRLNSLSKIEVREAAHGDRVRRGLALIAPGNRHMVVTRSGAQYVVQIKDGPMVSRHRPSVDVLFRSVAKYTGKNALGIIMTGMGDDGAAGMLEMRDAGVTTLAQDEESCVVFGMPQEAIKRGAAQHVVSLKTIPEHIVKFIK
jgi:two-component system chemotaxis response regulator CheB